MGFPFTGYRCSCCLGPVILRSQVGIWVNAGSLASLDHGLLLDDYLAAHQRPNGNFLFWERIGRVRPGVIREPSECRTDGRFHSWLSATARHGPGEKHSEQQTLHLTPGCCRVAGHEGRTDGLTLLLWQPACVLLVASNLPRSFVGARIECRGRPPDAFAPLSRRCSSVRPGGVLCCWLFIEDYLGSRRGLLPDKG